ncbi:MAG: hypothetical protein H0W09_08300 [Solirubrobacterales bacterium]|nr:hypothetical protein [Solirubrobacterales bacterium]
MSRAPRELFATYTVALGMSAAMLAFAAPAAATPLALAGGSGGDECLTAEPPVASAPAKPLRFGITPQLAGTVGEGQGEVVPVDPRKRSAALGALSPPRGTMVIRLNRLFMSDGRDGIRRFVRRARMYARDGYSVESQIRYHPRPSQEGDMDKWARFVERATRSLAQNPALVALTVTNEVNLPISENTSDGAYRRAIRAIVRGVPAAERVLGELGRRDVQLGFSYAYRYTPEEDADFFRRIGELAGKRFRRALDHVGLQVYPGLVWPPVLATQTAGEATLEALTLLRRCYMPKAGLGRRFGIWITENGSATNLGHTEERQARELSQTIRAVHRLSGTLGVSDYRYFNLRDNEPNGGDIFDNVGLLRADYSRKPAFEVFRRAVRRFGSRAR